MRRITFFGCIFNSSDLSGGAAPPEDTARLLRAITAQCRVLVTAGVTSDPELSVPVALTMAVGCFFVTSKTMQQSPEAAA